MGVPFRQISTLLIMRGRTDLVIAEAERFASATADERAICLMLLCDLDAARRMTHGDKKRTDAVMRIASTLTRQLKKDVRVFEAITATLSGDFSDLTRLVDWMTDDRLWSADDAIASGEIDLVALADSDWQHTGRW